MGSNTESPIGPDLAAGVPAATVPTNGALAGHVGDKSVLLSRIDGAYYAVSATCTHYGGPLAEGLIANGEVRCPWHHACFSLRTGAALAAPAFTGLQCYRVEVTGDRVRVRGKAAPERAAKAKRGAGAPARIVIVGGGGAGFAAAERLRTMGYDGTLTMLSDDSVAPCDRPNLSKDYLAGKAEADWMPLWPPGFYADHRIDLRLDCQVAAIDRAARTVSTRSGESFSYDALLLATGAVPVRLDTPGFDRPNVFALRTQADADAIVGAAKSARSAALIGAGFIGLEAAAALRARGLEVHVVAREEVPFVRVLGADLGVLLMELHRDNGVVFHPGCSATGYDGEKLALDDGSSIDADLVLVGVGVRPRTELAAQASLALDRGIVVDKFLQTSDPHIWAAGDVARYPLRGDTARIEHWVHAERQGQCAAANMLGRAQPYRDVPFFWTQHYDLAVHYVGHAESWDDILVDGSLAERDVTLRYMRDGLVLAAATVGHDFESLEIESGLRQLLASEDWERSGRQPPSGAASSA